MANLVVGCFFLNNRINSKTYYIFKFFSNSLNKTIRVNAWFTGIQAKHVIGNLQNVQEYFICSQIYIVLIHHIQVSNIIIMFYN